VKQWWQVTGQVQVRHKPWRHRGNSYICRQPHFHDNDRGSREQNCQSNISKPQTHYTAAIN